MSPVPDAILSTWLAGINRGDLQAVLDLYADQAVLVPTFASRVLDTAEKRQRYFEALVGREELSIALHGNTVACQPLRDDLCALSGIYCWRFAIDGELLSFEARFTFILDLRSPKPILHHHSSQIPRTL